MQSIQNVTLIANSSSVVTNLSKFPGELHDLPVDTIYNKSPLRGGKAVINPVSMPAGQSIETKWYPEGPAWHGCARRAAIFLLYLLLAEIRNTHATIGYQSQQHVL